MGTGPVGDATPDVEELQAREEFPEPVAVVPVAVQGPVRTQHLPILCGFSRSFTLGTADVPRRIVGKDLTRSRLLLWCEIGNLYVGYDEETVRSGNAARLPAGKDPTPFFAADEIWIKATGADAVVHMISEHWTL